jgi:hypothetical protein
VQKVAEADGETKTEFATLEQKVREVRAAAEEAARGATIDVDSASVAAAANMLARLKADGASEDRILERAVEAGDEPMLVALRRDVAYHGASMNDGDRAAVDQWGGTADFLSKLSEAERPFLSDEARAAREALAEADKVAGTLEGQRRLVDAITARQVKSYPTGKGGEVEQHLLPNQAEVNRARIAAAYAGVA